MVKVVVILLKIKISMIICIVNKLCDQYNILAHKNIDSIYVNDNIFLNIDIKTAFNKMS